LLLGRLLERRGFFQELISFKKFGGFLAIFEKLPEIKQFSLEILNE
jgi:hypothetical protein